LSIGLQNIEACSLCMMGFEAI